VPSRNAEVYEFTDADRSESAGLSLEGTGWRRSHDTVAIASITNRISAARRRFLDAGGLGLLIGDGRLPHAAPERILEAYYDVDVAASCHVTLDYQRIANPGYNKDRGPAGVIAVLQHAQF